MLDTNTIKILYDANKLAYHNWDHIETMMKNLDANFKQYLSEEQYALLQDAILFHDIIYVPGATDNEEKSAKVYILHQVSKPVEYGSILTSPAKRALSAVSLDQPVADDTHPVYKLIMATKTHTATKSDNVQLHALSKIIVDLDLWGLGDHWGLYRHYGEKIKEEFLSSGITLDQFNQGRKEWIRKFLERDRIYLTEFCEDRELQAIYNLKKELYLLNLQELNGLPVQQ